MEHRYRRRWVAALGIGLAMGPACGPEVGSTAESQSSGASHGLGTDGSSGPGASDTGVHDEGTDVGAHGSEGSSGTTTTSDTMGASTDSGECPDVHEGDLVIDETTDLDSLRTLGAAVGGTVYIRDLETTDLEFLACLHTIEHGLLIDGNPGLTTLHGLEGLAELDGLNVRGNPQLVSLSAVGVTKLMGLGVSGNATLTTVDLPNLQNVEALSIGLCEFSQPYPILDNPSLVSLDGLSGLKSLKTITIGSQSSLTSLARLHELAADGVLFGARITHNPGLPYEEVELLDELLGHPGVFYTCGNVDEPASHECICPMEGG